MTNPHINVTPLIDVLLVLLIIFMVVTPLKPESFKARVPSDDRSDAPIDPQTLVVIIGKDSSLTLNTEADLGTATDTEPLIGRLRSVFSQRIANGAASQQLVTDPERPFSDSIERTVFIKAPRRLDYGSVAHVVDAVKLAGAYPIGLQIDDVE